MRILLAEDDFASAKTLDVTLTKAGHTVTVGNDGAAAFELYEQQDYDILITDWMMPEMDGIELIHRVHDSDRPTPIVVMLTALTSDEARVHAMKAGADEFLHKPCDPKVVVQRLETLIARHAQPLPESKPVNVKPEPAAPPIEPARPASTPAPRPPLGTVKAVQPLPPIAGVLIASSTGGPDALHKVVRALPADLPAVFFLVQHGPEWMMETLCTSLQRDTSLELHVAEEGMEARAGAVYVAPGDHHMEIEPKTLRLHLTQDPPENYVRPAADPMMRTGARAFGRRALAVVLTGMGRDGAAGVRDVIAVGGTVLAQDPSTTVARSMPKTVIDLGLATEVVPLDHMGRQIARAIGAMDLPAGGMPESRAG